MNELMTKKVSVEFKPATLEINNFEELNKSVETVASKYDGLVFNAEDKKMAEQSRSELLEVRNAIEDRRKNIKKEFNEPLKEFENKVKQLTSKIDKPLNDIREGIKTIEQGEREQREHELNKFIKEYIDDKNVEIHEIEIENHWLNKGNFTTKGKLNKKTKDEIIKVVEEIVKDKEAFDKQKGALIAFCEAVDVDPKGWVGQLEFKDVNEVIDEIKTHLEEQSGDENVEVENEIVDNIFAAIEEPEQVPEFKERPKMRIVNLRATQDQAEKAVKLLQQQGFDARLEEEQLNMFDGIE